VNRKLIRTTLATSSEARGSATASPQWRRAIRMASRARATATAFIADAQASTAGTETHAEIYYYKKQIDAHTPMVFGCLKMGRIEGTIEWYDRGA